VYRHLLVPEYVKLFDTTSRVASSGVLFGRLSFSLMVLDPGLDPGLGEPIEFV
jgi:hypothetical protein